MLYMVIERFRAGNPKPVYERFAAKGRMMPDGVDYRASWVTDDGAVCYQAMEAESRESLDRWMENWADIVDFEVIPVIDSAEAMARFR